MNLTSQVIEQFTLFFKNRTLQVLTELALTTAWSLSQSRSLPSFPGDCHCQELNVNQHSGPDLGFSSQIAKV